MATDLLSMQGWQGKAYDGQWRALASEITVIEPATNQPIGRVSKAQPADVRAAGIAAKQAQVAWAAMPYNARAAIFRKAAALLEANREAYSTWIVRESGAIAPKAAFEIDSVIHLLHEGAAMPTQTQGVVLPSEAGTTSYARRVPHGVVGVISPFNFPFLLSSRSVVPALAAGNAVLLKPDPRTPVSGGVLLAALFHEAGLPAGVFHMLPGEADVGEALVSDPAVAMISFTGSTAAGRRVGELAGRHLKKVSLELGGKNALIVLDDADLDIAASGGAWASWLHQGQICMSAGRHLVHKDVAEAYGQRMAEKARNLPVGDPHTGQVALGPLITEQQADRVARLVDASVQMGARVLAGGKHEGRFYSPTVLADVTPDMPIFREETFGPVVAITTFGTDDEAVALAGDTEYGLSAGVYTRDVARGMAMADRLPVGLMHVNDQTVNDNGVMPMGGRGASGNGARHGGPANWDEFTQWQWVTVRSLANAPRYPL